MYVWRVGPAGYPVRVVLRHWKNPKGRWWAACRGNACGAEAGETTEIQSEVTCHLCEESQAFRAFALDTEAKAARQQPGFDIRCAELQVLTAARVLLERNLALGNKMDAVLDEDPELDQLHRAVLVLESVEKKVR